MTQKSNDTADHAGKAKTSQTTQKARQNGTDDKASKSAGATRTDPRNGAAQAARKAVKDTADATIGKVSDKVSATQDAAAERIRDTAEALNSASSRYPKGSPEREVAERIARSLSGAADQVGALDLPTIGEEVTRFARRHPAVFAGCAAMVGFAAARALKASARASDPTVASVPGPQGALPGHEVTQR